MPRPSSLLTLLDDALQIDICRLKRWGYLKPGRLHSGTLSWSRNGNPTGSIAIAVDMASAPPYIELSYKYRDEPRNYRVRLASVPSNLGEGEVWYFQCPDTGKRCRILYSVGGWFLHREAFRGCVYASQTRSKYSRELDRVLGPMYRSDELYAQLHRKYFKSHYAGKPTKRYLRFMEQIRRAESVPAKEVERLLAGL